MNFALYSGDWSGKSLKYKKMILYAMQMNSTDKMKLQVTKTRIVNLELFTSVRVVLIISKYLIIISIFYIDLHVLYDCLGYADNIYSHIGVVRTICKKNIIYLVFSHKYVIKNQKLFNILKKKLKVCT